jgi:cell division protein FtsL
MKNKELGKRFSDKKKGVFAREKKSLTILIEAVVVFLVSIISLFTNLIEKFAF